MSVHTPPNTARTDVKVNTEPLSKIAQQDIDLPNQMLCKTCLSVMQQALAYLKVSETEKMNFCSRQCLQKHLVAVLKIR